MKKLMILDKDGTIVRSASGKEFIDKPTDQELFPEVKPLIEQFIKNGGQIAIATNQGGVVSGYKTLKDAIAEGEYCMELLGMEVFMCLMCPDFEGRSAWNIRLNDKPAVFKASREIINQFGEPVFRKPGPGMMLLPMRKLELTPEDCFVVGDRPEDEGAARAAGMDFINAEVWRNQALN